VHNSQAKLETMQRIYGAQTDEILRLQALSVIAVPPTGFDREHVSLQVRVSNAAMKINERKNLIWMWVC
jgi:hypothetical protein